MADARDAQIWNENAEVLSSFAPHCWDVEGNFLRGSVQEELDVFGTHLRKTLLRLPAVTRCVDLGCGAGLWVNLFEGFDYIGVDQNTSMLSQARIFFPANKFVQGNGKNLSFLKPNTVDLIFTRAVIQHNQTDDDKKQVLSQIYDTLRPGGYYLCAEHDNTWQGAAVALGFEFLKDGIDPPVFLFRRR